VGRAEAAHTASAEAANVAAAEAAHVAPAAKSAVTTATAATRLRIAYKQAASERGGHQDSHCPSQHGFSFVSGGRPP
jgi:hypothetical protein